MCQPGLGPLPSLGVPTAMEGVLAFRNGTGSEVVAQGHWAPGPHLGLWSAAVTGWGHRRAVWVNSTPLSC